MSDIAKVIDRVRKLRKLATSSNANEAAAAAAQADRLVQEHRLAEAQIEADGGDAEAPAVDAQPLFVATRLRPWRTTLAVVLCKAYDVACWSARYARGGAGFAMCGRPSDVAIVRETFAWLEGEITRLAIATGNRSDSFRLGCVAGIRDAYRAERYRQRREQGNGQTSAAIVLADRGAQAEAARDAFLKQPLKSARPSAARHDHEAYSAGVAAGHSLSRKPTKQIT